MSRTTLITCLTVTIATYICVANGASSHSADFYVSTNGRDDWSGRLAQPAPDGSDGPFASIDRARTAVREKQQSTSNNLRVFIRGGDYTLKETVRFTLEDSASQGQTIEYSAYPGEEPVISSGITLNGWKRETPSGAVAAAAGKIWSVDVAHIVASKKGGDKRILTLYNKGRRLARARGNGFRPTDSITRDQRHSTDLRTLNFPADAFPVLTNIKDAEIVAIPCFYWVSNILQLESIDYPQLRARTVHPATYPLTRNGMNDRDSIWIENAIEVLDEPGEWIYNSSEKKIYLWPENEEPGDSISVPLLTELIRVEGAINFDAATDQPVRGLIFRGLHFTQGERFAWHGQTGKGLQHDWEMFDAPTALIRLRGAENCVVEDCVFSDTSHSAIRLDLHCIRNRVSRNRIARIGGVGILLAGYGPGTKDVNRHNIIQNNYIMQIGEIYWGSTGIFVWQSGENRITNNHIHHAPYTGIVVSGRIIWDASGQRECSGTIRWKETGIDPGRKFKMLSWKEREKFLHGRRNIVQRNDIHNVMQVLGDGNCIYISGTGADNIVRENYCHDCNGSYMNAGIRCDDDQHATIIERNIMQRTRGLAEGIISKGDNDIINNFIYDLTPDNKHRALIVFPYGDITGTAIRHNILCSHHRDAVPYYTGSNQRALDSKTDILTAQIDRNIYFNPTGTKWSDGDRHKIREQGMDRNSLEVDPQFKNPDAGDFSFTDESPAAKLGIESIDTTLIGLEPGLRERAYNRRITTAITPYSCFIKKPLSVTITCSEKTADIRYTLDGSEPTEESERYTGAITLRSAAFVRARAFAAGCTDLTGAAMSYSSNPPPVFYDFEAAEVGTLAQDAQTSEENAEMTARVSDKQAAGGTKSLKFIDGADQQYKFNPHLFYRTAYKHGKIQGTFDLLIDSTTSFSYQWRDYTDNYKCGAELQITAGGILSHRNKELMRLPIGSWISFKVICEIGDQADGTFDLEVMPSDAVKPHLFKALPYDTDFKQLDWVGFIANGVHKAVFYVDNIEVRQITDN